MSWLSDYLRRRQIPLAHHTRRVLATAIAKRGFKVGDYTYGAPRVRSWTHGGTLTIGSYCSIAAEVEILLGGNHRADWATTFPFKTMLGWSDAAAYGPGEVETDKRDVVIGSDVWIGLGALILPGVTIHDGAVIGARAVVARDVPPYGVVVGNPARLVRRRFPDEIVDALLEIKWWNLERHEIVALLPMLQSGDIAAFIAECRRRGHYPPAP